MFLQSTKNTISLHFYGNRGGRPTRAFWGCNKHAVAMQQGTSCDLGMALLQTRKTPSSSYYTEYIDYQSIADCVKIQRF